MSSSYLPIIISLLSLSLTVVTLYLAQLRSANISVLIGPEIQAYHADYPHISTAMYIPQYPLSLPCRQTGLCLVGK